MWKSAKELSATFFVALFLLVIAGGGCSKSGGSLSPEKAIKQRLDWNLQTTVEAYNSGHFTNPAWDSTARNCLEEFSKVRADEQLDAAKTEAIADNARQAVEAGCNDPMVNYLYIKFAMPQTNSKAAFAEKMYGNWKDMENSAYPPIRKFYAAARALEQMYSLHDTNYNPRISELLTFLNQNVPETLSDKKLPAEEAGDVAALILYLTSGSDDVEADFYRAEDQEMAKNWPEHYSRWYAKGNYYIDAAWNARGGGPANSVTPDGWRNFSNDLVQAQAAFEHAWKLDPNQAKIADQMITVMMGQGGARDRMEMWFNRAMEADTNNFDACLRKLKYLGPQWYGSTDDLLTFGRECVQSKKWGGRVPLILVEAHIGINSITDPSKQAEYWKQPQVWTDIQSAYERFFELNPNAGGTYYYYYALYAYRAEQWDKFSELLPKLQPVNYSFFGGKEEFDKMLQTAKDHTVPK